MDNKNLKCPICFDDFKIDDVVKYNCNHITCKDCDSKLIDNKCPICRDMLSGSNEKGYWVENSNGNLVWKLRENSNPIIVTRRRLRVRERRNILTEISRINQTRRRTIRNNICIIS